MTYYCGTFFCKKKAAYLGKLSAAKHGEAYDGVVVAACKVHTKDLVEVEAL